MKVKKTPVTKLSVDTLQEEDRELQQATELGNADVESRRQALVKLMERGQNAVKDDVGQYGMSFSLSNFLNDDGLGIKKNIAM